MLKPISGIPSCITRVLRRRMNGGIIPGVMAACLSGLALKEAPAQSVPFDDDFDSATYNNLDAIDNLSLWEANPGTNGVSNPPYPYISKSGSAGVAIVPIRANQNGFMRPIDSAGNPANWPFARTCENFVQVEFDLLPTLVGLAGSGSVDGVMGVYFTSVPQQGGLSDPGPLAAILFSWTSATGNGSAQIWAKGKSGSPLTVGPAINLGLMTSVRKFRVEFGWDYFTLPNTFKAAGQWPPSEGDPWVDSDSPGTTLPRMPGCIQTPERDAMAGSNLGRRRGITPPTPAKKRPSSASRGTTGGAIRSPIRTYQSFPTGIPSGR